jgi:hypothetical protein
MAGAPFVIRGTAIMTTSNEIFETIRNLSEADTADRGTEKRRPSWAPALTLPDEIVAALVALNIPIPDKKVARLWATFRGPDKVTTYLRNHASKLPMPEVRVRAFELHLSADRSGARLLQAKRNGSGQWEVSTFRLSGFPRWRELGNVEYKLRQARSDMVAYQKWVDDPSYPDERRGRIRDFLSQCKATVAEYEPIYAELKADSDRLKLKQSAFSELIEQRVAEFAGAPHAVLTRKRDHGRGEASLIALFGERAKGAT